MNDFISTLTHDERVLLTRTAMSILDSWGFTSEQVIQVLDLPEKTPKRHLRRYREDMPFPEQGETSQRLVHLVGIAEALRTTFPRNAFMGPRWMNQPQRRFDDSTPLEIIINNGLQGLIHVRSHLDCTYAWSQT